MARREDEVSYTVSMLQQWHYRVVEADKDPRKWEKELKSSGNEGWELVTIKETSSGSEMFILKSPKD